MALNLADRVRETTTVTGTGPATLLGAVTGYQAFSVVGDTNICYYTIADQSGPNWEVGIGTYATSGPTLTRTTVLASSNGGSAVNFTSGTKDIFLTQPAERAVYQDANSNVGIGGAPTATTGSGNMLVSGYALQPYLGSDGSTTSTQYAGLAVQNTTDYALTGAAQGQLNGIVVTPGMSNTGAGGTAVSYQIGAVIVPRLTSTGTAARFANTGMYMQVTRSNAADTSTYTANTLTGFTSIHGNTTGLGSGSVTGTSTGYSATAYNQVGTITSLYNFLGNSINIVPASGSVSSATVAQFLGNGANIGTGAGTATVSNYYGIRGVGITVGANGTVTNHFGLDLTACTVTGTLTNNYAIYQRDTAAKNYFGSPVGIGTNAPTLKLTVVPSSTTDGIRLTNGDANKYYDVIYDYTNNIVKTGWVTSSGYSTSVMAFYTSATEQMRIDQSGNMGLGTISTGPKLSIASGTGSGLYVVTTGTNTSDAIVSVATNLSTVTFTSVGRPSDNSSKIRFVNNAFSAETSAIYEVGGGNLAFSANGAERMRIDSSGNVGIGTSGSLAKLQVLSSASNSTVRGEALLTNRSYSTDSNGISIIATASNGTLGLHDFGAITFNEAPNSNGASAYVNMYAGGSSSSYDNASRFLRAYSPSGTGIDYVSLWTGSTERMVINSVGNIQIGGAGVASNTLRYVDIYNTDSGNGAGSILRLVTNNTANTTTTTVDLVKYRTGGFYIANNETNSAAFTSFNVGVSERMRITSAGFVGIGTTAPASLLELQGGFLTTSNTQQALGDILSTTASLVAGNWYRIATLPSSNQGQTVDITVRLGNTHNNTVIKVAKGTGAWRAEAYRAGFYVNPAVLPSYTGIEKVRVYDVGVNGVTHIDIQVAGNTQSLTYNVIVNQNTCPDPSNRVTLVALTDQGTTAVGIEFQCVGQYASWGNYNGQAMTIADTNFVGIGTATPAAKLHIVGTGNPTLRIDATGDVSTGGYNYVPFYDSVGSSGYIGYGGVANGFGTVNALAGGFLYFSTGGYTERMRIDSAGNVGIGVTPITGTTTGLLQLAGGINIPGTNLGIASNVYYQGAWKYNGNGSGGFISMARSSTIAMEFNYAPNNAGGAGAAASVAPAMSIDTGGNVLIGVQSGSDFKLRVLRSGNFGLATLVNSDTSGITYDQFQVVVGQAAASSYFLERFYTSAGASPQFAVRGDGTIYAQNTTVQAISDVRTKENIVNATDGLDVITALRPVRFDFKEGFGNEKKNQLGFIAQEIENVFPDAVDVWGESDDPKDPYKSVGPSALIPVLVKAIQEQQALIENLTNRLNALEGK